MKKIKIEACPFCGGTAFVKGWQNGYGMLHSGFMRNQVLFHIICSDCGSVVRSYVEDTNGMKLYEEE